MQERSVILDMVSKCRQQYLKHKYVYENGLVKQDRKGKGLRFALL